MPQHERSGYTATMFVIDVGASMAKTRYVQQSDGSETETTSLEWALKYVKFKVQDMIYRGLKTDKCGIIVFGSEKTNNIINEEREDEYKHIEEYMDVHQPDAKTIAKLDKLRPSSDLETSVDPMDALIVAMQTQDDFLGNKKWTRRIVLITDGETPMELEDWDVTAEHLISNEVKTYIIGVDFDDDDDDGFKEAGKSVTKKQNEAFWHEFEDKLNSGEEVYGILGSLAQALTSVSQPDTKRTKSALTGAMLRLGDVETRPEQAFEISIKTGKCTAIARPKSFKKYALSTDIKTADEDEERTKKGSDSSTPNIYVPLGSRSSHWVPLEADEDEVDGDGDVKMEDQSQNLLQVPSASQAREKDLEDRDEEKDDEPTAKGSEDEIPKEEVPKEDLVRGYKYGATFVPAPDDLFEPLPSKPGMQIIAFFPEAEFRREYSMGEMYYVYADPAAPAAQVAFSSIVRAMRGNTDKTGELAPLMAIVRWVKRGIRERDGGDPIMGVLKACDQEEGVDFFLFTRVPFADDVRKYTFPSLDNLVSKTGEAIATHPYLPTEEQLEAMDDLVDAMDLMEADEDDEGERIPWFEPQKSYNPAIHRVKQAMLHTGIVEDVTEEPCPPPHEELTKYFNPPEEVVEVTQEALDNCKAAFNVKAVPKRVAKARGDGHFHAAEDADQPLLLDRQDSRRRTAPPVSQPSGSRSFTASPSKKKARPAVEEAESTDEEDEAAAFAVPAPVKKAPGTPVPPSVRGNPLPTPARSLSPPGDDDAGMDIDRGVAPGRIIGNSYPLEDFKKNLSQGDIVSKAVEDIADVISEIVLGKFPHRRHAEMIECMRALRDTCLNEDEILAWNDFIRELKDRCLEDDPEEPSNPDFWEEVKKLGMELTLIGASEAAKARGKSKVPDARAKKFIE